LMTKALSADSQAAAKASFGAAKTMLANMKDDEGRSLNIRARLLVVPPALEDIANTLMTTDRLDDGKANLYKGAAKVLVSSHLKTDTEWHLMDNSKVIKAILFQLRKKPVFVSQQNPDSPDVFNRAVFKFGCEARGAAGYGLWQLSVGSTGTT
jgi:phage major head subunit gpT-like protein